MKKIALTSLLALFAVSSANAATNYFVGGAAALATNSEHQSVLGIAPEFGWKLNSDWDLGFDAHFALENRVRANKYESTDFGKYDGQVGKVYEYGADIFARYKVAQIGGVKLLLKGSAGVDMATFSPDADNLDAKTLTFFVADIKPMITYDVSEAITLYATLDFLGAHAQYNLKNDDLNIPSTWEMGLAADSGSVANTKDFQIGFNYNF